MAEISEPRAGTYRCPVCGHRDVAELRDQDRTVVACSYCGTALMISSRGADSVRLMAQVAGGGTPR
ncbi:MAG TPA: hypothetical protein VF188_05380 [Longimicrobiales bacterium]